MQIRDDAWARFIKPACKFERRLHAAAELAVSNSNEVCAHSLLITPRGLPLVMPTQISRRKTDLETHALRALLAAAGCVIVAAALRGNAGSVLLALATCLACLSRIERNYRRGAYGAVIAGTVAGAGLPSSGTHTRAPRFKSGTPNPSPGGSHDHIG
jgi:hypothetical protein